MENTSKKHVKWGIFKTALFTFLFVAVSVFYFLSTNVTLAQAEERSNHKSPPAAEVAAQMDDTKLSEKTQQDVLELKEGVLDPLSDITEVENSEDDPDAVEEVQEVVPTVCSYCGSENHSSSICAKRSIANGAYGRWVIPSVGCNVAAYSCNWDADQSYVQEITDSSDSAAFLTCGGVGVLADQNDQGFCGLSNISVGAKAYMDFGDGATYYECYQVEYGHNTGEKMLDGNGNIMSYSNYSSGTVICYTCLDHWTNIYITYWTPV